MLQKQDTQHKYVGIWPVMLTPFDENREVDYGSLARLIEWYLAAGVQGLFAACQSSEMFFLSDRETQQLVRFIVQQVDGRVPVVASGHTASGMAQQIDQLNGLAQSGVDGLILISNRLTLQGESDEQALQSLQTITAQLPENVDLGIYECPYPYKRLLSEQTVAWCAQSQRYTFIKDTCCDLSMIRRRLALTAGSRLHLANANSQTLLASFQAGCQAYSGVMANFHPQLYVWLYEHWRTQPEQAHALADYLATAALAEHLDYPACAKFFQQQTGNFATHVCRVRSSAGYSSTFFPAAIDSMMRLGESLSQRILEA